MDNNNIINRYSDEELEEFKEMILDKLSKAEQELKFVQSQMTDMHEKGDSMNAGSWEHGSQNAELEKMTRIAARQQQFVKYLRNALIRIENKTYGICMATGKLIDKERLRLVPHATKSIEVKILRDK